MKKEIHKAIEQLNGIYSSTFNKDNEINIAIVNMLREVQGITFDIFEALLPSFQERSHNQSSLHGHLFPK